MTPKEERQQKNGGKEMRGCGKIKRVYEGLQTVVSKQSWSSPRALYNARNSPPMTGLTLSFIPPSLFSLKNSGLTSERHAVR